MAEDAPSETFSDIQLNTSLNLSLFQQQMGNNAPSLKGLDPRFQELGLDENELLSTLIVVKDTHTQEKLLIKQINVASQVEYNRILKELNQRKVHSAKKIGRYLLRVRDVEGRQQSQICGKSFKLLVYLEFISGSLRTVFQQRVRTGRRYDQDELLSIIKSVVSGLIMLHDNNFKNIHICKEAVLVTSENTYKIMDTQLCNRIHPYFEILNGVPPKSGIYLAPELLKDIRKGVAEFYPSPKADLFTLGVLILELATLQPMDSHYDYEQKTLDLEGLQRKVMGLPMSEYFKKIIFQMLEEQEEERIGLLSLKEKISGGLETQANEELCAYNSISQLGRHPKESARTFISRTKQSTSRPESSQTTKDNHAEPPANGQQISQYVAHLHSRPTPIPLPVNNAQFPPGSFPVEVVNRQLAIQPHFVPIEANFVRMSHRPNPQMIQRRVMVQTPKSEAIQIRIQNTREFETPVNFLLETQQRAVQQSPYEAKEQPQESEQVREHTAAVNQKTMQEIAKNEENKKWDMFSSKAEVLSSKSEVVYSKSEAFNNKSYGQLQFGNGARYEGEFNLQGEFEGNGILYYPNGKPCYSGSWKANAFHGFGVLYSENPQAGDTAETPYWELKWQEIAWSYYEGQFKMDKKEGFGTLYLSNGDKFSGCFKDDAIEGFGSFYIAKEAKYINGIWVNNILKH